MTINVLRIVHAYGYVDFLLENRAGCIAYRAVYHPNCEIIETTKI